LSSVKTRLGTVDNTTDTGSIDAVAASIIEAPAQEEQVVEDAEIIEDDEAPETEAEAQEPEAEADAEASEDDEDEEPAADEEPAQPTYTVKVDGKVKQVTLDELRRGYSGQAFIQQGMEQLAEARKAMQSEYQTLQSERQRIAEVMGSVQNGQGITPPKPPAKELLTTDPIGYMQAKVEYDEQVAQYQRVQAQYQQIQQQERQRTEAQHQAYLQQQLQILQQAVPEFADPKKAPAYRDKILQAGQNYYGIDPQELSAIADARYLSVLNDAMKYRQIQEARGEVDQKAQNARPVVKPGVKRNERSSQQKKAREVASRMRQTGSVDDVAKFLLS
jgi:hypothetical protein